MLDNRPMINAFLVEVFNQILRYEEKALRRYEGGKLSVKEFHVIEAVFTGTTTGENTMGEIARRLGVTMGTLTTAANTLEKKGFLTRIKCSRDKRSVRLFPTAMAERANAAHMAFHTRMVEAVTSQLDDEQLSALIAVLGILREHFHQEADRAQTSQEEASWPYES